MSAGNLRDFVEQQCARGKTREEIRRHLESQGWDQAAIERAFAPADAAAAGAPPPLPAGPSRGRRGPLAVAGLAALVIVLFAAALTAIHFYRQYAQAKMVREKLRHVQVAGKVTARLAAGQSAEGAPFELVDFKGDIDSSDVAKPRTSFRVGADPAGGVAAALEQLTIGTDARLLGLSLVTLSAAGKLVGGIEWRLIDGNIYLRFERPPLGGQANLISAFVEGLVGPSLLSNAWLRVPAPAAGGGDALDENQALWALMLRPTEQIFGHSKELAFVGARPAETINGMATEVHRYSVDGEWATSLLADSLERAGLEEHLALIAALQKLLTGSDPGASAGGLDTIRISDGEMEVWVGKRDKLPQRIVTTFQIREGTEQSAALQVRAEVNFSYGSPVQIEAPQSSMGLEDLEKQLQALGALSGGF